MFARLADDSHQQDSGAAVAHHPDLVLDEMVGAAANGVHQGRHFRNHFRKFAADHDVRRQGQELGRRPIGQFDPALPIESDHARGHAGQHGLAEAAAFVQFPVGFDQFGALGRELAGHAVEGARQGVEFVARGLVAGFDPGRQIAFADPFGGVDQPDDRRGQLRGETEPGPDRTQKQQTGDHDVDSGEGQLQGEPRSLLLLVFRRGAIGALDLAEHPGIDETADIEVKVAIDTGLQ